MTQIIADNEYQDFVYLKFRSLHVINQQKTNLHEKNDLLSKKPFVVCTGYPN